MSIKKSLVRRLAVLFIWTSSVPMLWSATLEQIQPLMQKYCVECHGEKQAEAELQIDKLMRDVASFPENHRVLDDISFVVDFGEMPPAKYKVQPSDEERELMVNWALDTLEDLQDQHKGDPGRVVMPRVTRSEYDRVIRDLTGVHIQAAELLPSEGGAGEGFSNVGEAHSISVIQIEKYLNAAKYVLSHMIATPSGWHWAEFSMPKAESREELQENLLTVIRLWYTNAQKSLIDNPHNNFKEAYGHQAIPYFEILGHYLHAIEAGAKPSLATIAAEKFPNANINTKVIERLHAWIRGDAGELPPYAKHQIGSILSTLSKENLGSTENREELEGKLSEWRRLPTQLWQMNWAPDFELSYAEGEKRDKTQDEALEGIWNFEIDLSHKSVKNNTLYLLTTAAHRPDQKSRIKWSDGIVHMEDGSKQEWGALIKQNAKLLEGSIEMLNKEESAGYLVTLPSLVQLIVPEGAERFEVTASVPDEFKDKALAQVLILPSKPEEDRLLYWNRRRVLGHPRQAPLKGWLDEIRASKNILRKNRNYSKDAIPLNGMLPDETLKMLGYNVNRLDEREAPPNELEYPFYVAPAELRERADKQAIDELTTLYQLLASLTIAEEETVLTQKAAEQIAPFMEKAWRRPVTEEEVNSIVALVPEELSKGYTYDSAVKQVLLAVLMAPDFIYRLPEERLISNNEPTLQLTGLELASRLSFALWSSIPDERLLELGKSGELTNPDVLVREAMRMLEDEKAQSLSEEFSAQWFRYKNFYSFSQPNDIEFPEFTSSLAKAMYDEMRLFFDDLIRNDRPILNVLSADYTYLNEELAKHYGIEGVEGGEMRKVELPADSKRGGVAAMGAVLTKYSAPLRTSPVKRGVYVIEEILGQHLPNPPPGVPALSDEERNDEGLTIADQLARHRDDPACLTCHVKFDPLGIAMENFDAIGRWRETDKLGEPIANSDVLPDGTKLAGFASLRSYLASQDERFVHNFSTKLLGYMLGRGVEAGDKELLEQMDKALVNNDYRFSSALEVVLRSPQFLTRRTNSEIAPADYAQN